MDRFSKLYGNSAVKKAERKLSMQLSKNQKAPEANGNGTAGYMVKSGKNSGKILKHLKTRAKDVAKQGNLFISRMPVVPYKSVQDTIRGKNDSMS